MHLTFVRLVEALLLFTSLVASLPTIAEAGFHNGSSCSLHSLNRRGDPTSDCVALDQARLKNAMKDTSHDLASSNEFEEVIVQGGGSNVMMGGRSKTGDMDFVAEFPILDRQFLDRRRRLISAMTAANAGAKKRGYEIPSDWFDGTFEMHFRNDPELKQRYIEAARRQNVVFQHAERSRVRKRPIGVRFIAAPWDFQIVRKLVKIDELPGKPTDKDLRDTAQYFGWLADSTGERSFTEQDVLHWFRRWKQPVPSSVSRTLRDAKKFDRHGYIRV